MTREYYEFSYHSFFCAITQGMCKATISKMLFMDKKF